MRREDLYLTDIVEAADHIARFLAGTTFEYFQSSELLRSAVLQKLTVIGEAASRVSDNLQETHPQIPWPQIVSFRNILVHAYFGIDWEIVWRAAINRCPELRDQVATILGLESATRAFERYIGIDYSGAQTPASSLSGLRIFQSTTSAAPSEVPPPPGPRKYWTRRGIAEWLEIQLLAGPPTIVGIDHAFSFPEQYFQTHNVPRDWQEFLNDFRRHWPTHEDHMYVDFIRDGLHGAGSQRGGNTRWRRRTEQKTRAKSVFHFNVPGSVAHSTHAGLPWLLHLKESLLNRVHFWPFDGWEISADKSAIVEVYPALCSSQFPRSEPTQDQHDAYSVSAWLRKADSDGSLKRLLNPALNEEDRRIAAFEGWILGVDPK